jgi:hypothetical protein
VYAATKARGRRRERGGLDAGAAGGGGGRGPRAAHLAQQREAEVHGLGARQRDGAQERPALVDALHLDLHLPLHEVVAREGEGLVGKGLARDGGAAVGGGLGAGGGLDAAGGEGNGDALLGDVQLRRFRGLIEY